jgi:hypothetical protein
MRAGGKRLCGHRPSETPRDQPAQESAGNPPRTNQLVIAGTGTTKEIGALKIEQIWFQIIKRGEPEFHTVIRRVMPARGMIAHSAGMTRTRATFSPALHAH